MTAAWLLALALLCACAGAERGGSQRGGSLRGALEALQRRQRGRPHPPVADYDVYEVLPPNAYVQEPDYAVDIEALEEDPATNYILKLLEENDRPNDAYEYKLVKKKNNHQGPVEINRKESPFRERSHHSDNDRLRDLFMDRNEVENSKAAMPEHTENDAEYALFLSQLWSKYKNNKAQHNAEGAPQGVVKMYKEKIVKKRYPENWGPIAFKKKRSPDIDTDHPTLSDFEGDSKGLPGPVDPSNYNAYDLSDDDKDDLREEYAIAFQPLDDDNLSDIADDDQYAYDVIEKRFPVTKRSSGPYDWGKPIKRFAQEQDKRDVSKRFRSSSGTDPKIIKDLSELFGASDPELMKNPVKRSSEQQANTYESKPPQLVMFTQNHTNTERSNASASHDESSHEHQHSLHHPGISGKEVEHVHDHDHGDKEKPITIKKKSIDWSTYFGIDKRKKKSVSFVNDLTENKLRKQYFDTFNKEVIYPLNSFRKHSNVKRNYVQRPENEETEIQIDNARAVAVRDGDKRNTAKEQDKLDNIDKKLRTMEGMIVDEALHYSNVGEELDTKEEQEMKEKLLSKLAAAYSLEKMRKALKDFKQSLQTQRPDTTLRPSSVPMEEAKEKRVAIKKEKVDINNNEIPIFSKVVVDDNDDNFEEEQGAGHYLNGKIENQFSEGYMGGSGTHRTPVIATGSANGACPVLTRIVQRCRGVDMLAGDRGQLFLPLCSLHQICYLCGEAPPTTCDLVFLSEADTACEGDTGCQRAARSALMALRELHDSLADELDGECEASPCLPATLKLNVNWQRALQR